jgi:glycosyltransferase involved in cell wall biosynthesis
VMRAAKSGIAAKEIRGRDEAEMPSQQVKSARVKKKLLYLSVCDPDLQVTGATVRMGAFVRHLGQFYDVTLVNMAGSGYRVASEIEERFHDRENRLGVAQRVRVAFSQPGYFLFSPTLYRQADRLLKTGSFAYLLVDYGLAAIYGKLFVRRYAIPMVYSSHNIEYQKYLEQSKTDPRRAVLAPYVYWAERAACRAARLVVAISESDRDKYTQWVEPKKIEVIPQGFDAELCNPFYTPPPSSPAVVLFVGNFRLEHNREAARLIVAEIMPRVARARSDVKFQLVGADPPRDLRAAHVEYTGFVDDLGPYLRRANLVIAPMHFGFGMSTKIVSALAYGKPVLATPQGAGAISRNYRQLVVSSLDGFARRIVDLLETRPAVDAQDFASVCDEFAWTSIIARLYRRIEERCAPDPVSAAG